MTTLVKYIGENEGMYGQTYTVVREGDENYFLSEIEGGSCPVPKSLFVLVPSPSAKGGVKHDSGKPRLDLLSVPALFETARVLQYGAIKYSPNNWRDGFEWSRLYAAALRHLLAHMNGEDIDPETGLSHLSHAACCIMFLQEHEIKKLGTDDRYKHA